MKINYLSACSSFVSIKFNYKDDSGNVGELGIGTGFYYKFESKLYFITNWHNVSGRNPENLKLISKSCAQPDFLEVKAYSFFPNHNGSKDGQFNFNEIEYPLYKTDDGEQIPYWYEHPIHKYKVDIIAIPISEGVSDNPNEYICAINDIPFIDNLSFGIGDDVFIIGYPFGIASSNLPVWKKGSIASEYFAQLDQLPKFLVDTASRPGMSGSPVLLLQRRIHKRSGSENIFKGDAIKPIGVYSGRIQEPDPNSEDKNNFINVQLGIVWRWSLIEEIISGALLGNANPN